MAVLDVINYGHPLLRQIAEPYQKDEVTEEFIQDMLETMKEEDGVGLAAPQVNVSKRLITLTDFKNEYVLFNPEIIAHSEQKKTDIEGCLSLPGLQAMVPRYEKVIVRAMNQDWEPVEIKGSGLLAVVLQHEIDHLNGILYIDRADLDTLVWIEYDDEGDKSTKIKTTVKEVQEEFEEIFHRGQDNIVFAPQNTIV